MKYSILTAATLALTLPALAQQTITCSSTNGTRFCPANTANGVILLQEHSDGVCQQGSTWSYTRRGISVKGGCSADFQVGGNAGNNNNSGSYGNNGYNNQSNQNNQNDNPNNNNQNNYPNNNNQNRAGRDGSGNSNNNGNNGYGNNNGNSNNANNNNGYGNNNGNRQQTAPVIPSGTRLDVRLEQTVNINDVNQGDFIPATLVNDLAVNGRVIASSGTAVQAKVVSAHGSPLDIRLDSMSVNGQNYRLVSSSIHGARDSQSAQNSDNQTASQEIGSVLGALTGGGRLPSGSVYTFRLTSPAHPAPAN